MVWQRNNEKRQLKAIFDWLTTVAGERDVIFVDLPKRKNFFSFAFPIRFGDDPQKIRRILPEQTPTFLIRIPQRTSLPEPWINVFYSPEIEVWEHRSRIRNVLPLRWGLSEDEQRLAIKIARDAINHFLKTGKVLETAYYADLPARFYLKTDVDVSFWLDGSLRGSAIAEGRHLSEGIAEATVKAFFDPRFKPLTENEIERIQIAITIPHDLRMPLLQKELQRSVLYPEKGYLIEKNGQRGWFFPFVLNQRRFKGLKEFLDLLAQEKIGGGSAADTRDATAFISEVNAFIESGDHETAFLMRGPVIPPSTFSFPEIEPRLRQTADWLLTVQEPDGNSPPIINPLSGRRTQIDWPRSALTSWGLAEFASAIGEDTYKHAARRNFEFLRRNLFRDRTLPTFSPHILAYVFFGDLALTLKMWDSVQKSAEIVEARIPFLNLDPLTITNIASFLADISLLNRSYLDIAHKLAKAARDRFENERRDARPINLPVWAELVNLSYLLGMKHGHREWKNSFYEIGDWFAEKQFPDGSFPEFHKESLFTYTRGVAKIFEVLAREPERYQKIIFRTLAWLFSMQYHKEQMFFISTDVRPLVAGAFRHDYLNHEAWIDATGHALLGYARFLRRNQDKPI